MDLELLYVAANSSAPNSGDGRTPCKAADMGTDVFAAVGPVRTDPSAWDTGDARGTVTARNFARGTYQNSKLHRDGREKDETTGVPKK